MIIFAPSSALSCVSRCNGHSGKLRRVPNPYLTAFFRLLGEHFERSALNICTVGLTVLLYR